MFVYVAMARRLGGEWYILAIFAQEHLAREHAARWLTTHPEGDVLIHRYAVIDGR
jgi:hypothetical protein